MAETFGMERLLKLFGKSSAAAVLMTLLFIVFSIPFASAVRAAPAVDDLYTVKGIQIDKTASTAAVARERALLEAEQKAYALLLKRITMPLDADRLPVPAPEDLVNLVSDVEITDEKTSSVRYIAMVKIRFKPQAIKDLLQENSIPYVNATPKPVLVLPAYNHGKDNFLWDEGNIWFTYWRGRTFDSALVPLVIPYGDAEDMEYTSGDVNTAALLERYGASAVLLDEMTHKDANLAVAVMPLGVEAKKIFSPFNLKVSTSSGEKKALDAVAKAMSEKIDADWRDDNVVHFSSASSIVVIVPINNLADWLEVKKRLEKVSVIKRYDLQAIRADKVQLTLFFGRGIERLSSDLANQKLELKQAGSGLWVISDKQNRNIEVKGESKAVPQSDETVSVFGIDEHEGRAEDSSSSPASDVKEEKDSQNEGIFRF